MKTQHLLPSNALRCLLLFSALEGLSFAAVYLKLPPSSANSSSDPFDATASGRDERLHIFTVDYEYVQIPCEVTLWIILASLAKIGEYKYSVIFKSMFPCKGNSKNGGKSVKINKNGGPSMRNKS